MIKKITNTFAVVGLLIAGATAAPASADTYSHIDRLAVRINNRAKQIVRETKHYQHTPEYGHLVADAQALCRLATHIHEVTHFEGNLFHLRSDIAELDAQFHHLNEVVSRIEHNAAYGVGHIHGHTRNVRRLLNLIEDDIHHLQEDLNSLQPAAPIWVTRPVIVAPVPAYNYVPVAPRSHYDHGHGHYGGRGSTFSFGGGNSRITFRF